MFGPAGGVIDAVEGVGEHTGEGFAAMSCGIGFGKTGARLLPLVDLDGDLVSEDIRFVSIASSFGMVDAGGAKD